MVQLRQLGQLLAIVLPRGEGVHAVGQVLGQALVGGRQTLLRVNVPWRMVVEVRAALKGPITGKLLHGMQGVMPDLMPVRLPCNAAWRAALRGRPDAPLNTSRPDGRQQQSTGEQCVGLHADEHAG